MKFFINIAENSWPASQRERGTYEAFDGSEPNFNQIVSFIDCDDGVAPVRVKVVEQAFKENPELNVLTGAFRRYNLAKENEQVEVCSDEMSMKDMFCHSPPEGGYSDEDYEDLFKSVFDFRDQDNKLYYYNRARSHDHMLTTNDPPALIDDPWNPEDGNVNLEKSGHFAWSRPPFSDMPTNGLYPTQSGHTSWRRDWLINDIKIFPNTRYGEDNRLLYATLQKGGNILGIHKPLTYYTIPQGNTKRRAFKELIDWNREKASN